MTRCGLFVGLATVAVLAACNRDDATLTAKVQSNVNQSVKSPTANVEVQVSDGVVTLSGTVPTAPEKERAKQAAKQIDGVKEVRDDLKVSGEIPPAPASSP